jgi:regulator of replication initiation timing
MIPLTAMFSDAAKRVETVKKTGTFAGRPISSFTPDELYLVVDFCLQQPPCLPACTDVVANTADPMGKTDVVANTADPMGRKAAELSREVDRLQMHLESMRNANRLLRETNADLRKNLAEARKAAAFVDRPVTALVAAATAAIGNLSALRDCVRDLADDIPF